MLSIFLAILAYFFNAITSVIDKFLLNKGIPNSVVYAFYMGILSIFVLPLFLVEFFWPGWF